MTGEEVIRRFRDAFKDRIVEAEVISERRVNVEVPSDLYRDAVRLLKEIGMVHLQTITATDLGDSFEVSAHMGRGLTVTVKTKISKEKPVIGTLTDIIPGAELYEREVHDLLGIEFEGHPNLRRLILPEDWPKGVYPLRKDFKPEHPKPLRG